MSYYYTNVQFFRYLKTKENDKGLIDLNELIKGLDKFNIQSDKSEIKKSMESLTKSHNENILLKQFLDTIRVSILLKKISTNTE